MRSALLPGLQSEGGRVNVVELPQHVADAGDWKAWPRKSESHVKWSVRERQVSAYVRNGKLKAYRCPDGSVRIEPEALTALFGPPGALPARDRDLPPAERRRRLSEAADVDDPVASMFRAVVGMMHDMHHESVGLIRTVTEPVQVILTAYKDTIAQQAERIRTLESHADESLALRSELADASQEREVSLARHKASEKRRDETLTLLKDQVPALVKLYIEGESLSGWVRKVPRDAIEAMLDSGALSDSDADQLRRAAGISKPAPPPTPPTNGMQS